MLRDLKGTTSYGILFKKGGENEELLAFADSDYPNDTYDHKSMSGYVFLLSSVVVSWLPYKQSIVTLLTTEVEFMVVVAFAC